MMMVQSRSRSCASVLLAISCNMPVQRGEREDNCLHTLVHSGLIEPNAVEWYMLTAKGVECIEKMQASYDQYHKLG
jgi:predicted transcriptional regulator